MIQYECQAGYELLGGDLVRTCMADKTFSGSAPVCRSKSNTVSVIKLLRGSKANKSTTVFSN